MRLAYIFAIFGLLLSSGVRAGEVGRTTLNGRIVILDSAGTWAYDDAAVTTPLSNFSCNAGSAVVSKKLPISICFAKPWRVDSSTSGAMEVQALQPDLDLYVGLITERTQIPTKALREGILYNAAGAAGVRLADVPVLKETVETLNGVEWNYIEYEVAISGAKFRFGNYNKSLGEHGVVQVVFWSSAAFFEQSKPSVVEMMNSVKLNEPRN